MKEFLGGLLIVVVGVLVLWLLPNKTQAPTNNNIIVADFQSCVNAGYEIVPNSSPAQCRTPGGVTYTEVVSNPDAIIDTPKVADVVTSPLRITGKVRGNWFFEANLPIVLKDENGVILAQKGYMTAENWMTTDYINVDTTLSFRAPSTDYGVLIISNDNPSGLPENDKSVSIPVRFR